MKRKILSIAHLKTNIIFLGLFLSLCIVLNTHAKDPINPVIEAILNKAETAFDQAISENEQFEIVSKPISAKYTYDTKLCNNFKDFEENQDYHHNVLALAIAHGDFNRTKKFMNVIEDINNNQLNIWMNKKRYNLAHLALNPQLLACYNWNLDERYKIIKLLARNNINFNYNEGNSNSSLTTDFNIEGENKNIVKLKIFALINGADISGFNNKSYKDILEDDESLYFRYMLKYGKKYGFEKLHDSTRQAFKKGWSFYKKEIDTSLS